MKKMYFILVYAATLFLVLSACYKDTVRLNNNTNQPITIGQIQSELDMSVLTVSSEIIVEDPTPDISPSIQSEYIKITSATALRMDPVYLDVRTQEEFDDGHIPGAVLVPDNDIKEMVEAVLPDKDQTILVYCQSGVRSERTSRELIAMGYTRVYDLGGIIDWTDEIVGNWLHPSYYNYYGDPLPPDIITPIDMTTTLRVTDKMQDYSVHLVGRNIKRFGLSYDNTKFYIMYDENQIETITITDNSGAVFQVIDGLTTANPGFDNRMYGLSFNDWNFDGYVDIGLWAWQGGSMRNRPHYYWLWDESLGQFIENTELMNISLVSYIETNAEKNQIRAFTRYGGDGGINRYFEYIDEHFVLVYTVETINKWVAGADGEDDKVITCITIGELIDGQMIFSEYYQES